MRSQRAAFTLVELMVAMTLTIFVMVILSQSFVQGLETFSGLKAIGDMQEELHTATTLLRAELTADHFEGKRRLSDPRVNLASDRIREGFFVVGQGYPPTGASRKFMEGTEDGVPSQRAVDHWLHFSVKMRGNARERFFAAPAPGLGDKPTTIARLGGDAVFQDNNNVVHSAWAEVAYLLVPTGTTVNPGIPVGAGTPLHALYRCQYVVIPAPAVLNSTSPSLRPGPLISSITSSLAGGPFASISGLVNAGPDGQPVVQFLSPNDLANGHASRTFNPYTYFASASGKPPLGAALVLSNVVSFQVQILKSPGSGEFEDLGLTAVNPKTGRPTPIPFDTANYVSAPTLPPVYGGAALTPTEPPYSIAGLQIILRIWDPKSRLTRQVTLLQDM